MLSDDIKEIHEYEADKYVLEHHSDAGAYQLLLLKKAAQGKMFPLANNFGRSSVRRRITMMARKRSSRSNCAKSVADVGSLHSDICTTRICLYCKQCSNRTADNEHNRPFTSRCR